MPDIVNRDERNERLRHSILFGDASPWNAILFGCPPQGSPLPGIVSPFRCHTYRAEVSICLGYSFVEVNKAVAEVERAFREQMVEPALRLSQLSPADAPQSPAAEQQLEQGEALFQRQALQDPEALLRVLRERNLGDAQLAFAAEAARGIEDSAKAVDALLLLLDHRSSVVREAVVGGLAPHLEQSERARNILQRVAHNDPSAAVKKAASEALENV